MIKKFRTKVTFELKHYVESKFCIYQLTIGQVIFLSTIMLDEIMLDT